MNQAPNKLLVREALAIIVFSGMLLGISLISILNRENSNTTKPAHLLKETLSVEVIGAVEKPGIYSVPKQGAVSALITQSNPLPNASFHENLKVQKNKKGECYLAIATQQHILVYIENIGWKELPENTRICDIKDHISIDTKTDPKFLKRKRLLRNGEILALPMAKPKSTKA